MALVTDMLGRGVEVPERPQRIISLVPSQTELLADLGLENEVVGITKFCVHPETWFRSKARIGGTKMVHLDRVKSLRPDLIIANKEENVREQIEALEMIAPVWVSDIHTLDDSLRMIRELASLCGRTEAGESIATRIEDSFAALTIPVAARKTAYCIWREPWMWAGGDTFIHDILKRCGLENALQEIPRYPELDLERLRDLNPELVLLSSEPYPFREQHIAEIQALLPSAKVRLVDGEMFSWYGSRLLRAPEYLADLLQSL
jgi:ABC-type Fe3+-hydroxamate transport system substrate-binding protein